MDEARQARREDWVGLLGDVDGIRRGRQRECVRLLQELTPHLHAARAVERELDHQLARRFNIFRYLHCDELGLSRIIADLLDPNAEHGQGTTFLESMLELLGVAPEVHDSARPQRALPGRRNRAATCKGPSGRLRFTAIDKIRVVPERALPAGRRIDVTVDIPTDEGFFCLAFENKPYAADQPGQCRDYLEFLDSVYRGRFLLVYLPPRYRLPDESSLPPPDRERWKNHFRVLPYCRDDAPSGDEDPSDGNGLGGREPDSLADWFENCGKLSDADRLRWFLREAQLFCQHHFGDSTMTDTEARYIREYLDENPRHLHAAFAVHRAWSGVREDVFQRFLEHLRDRVEERLEAETPEIRDDLQVGCHYAGANQSTLNVLWITRTSWVEYDDAPERERLSRTSILFQSQGKGMNNWRWGVRSPKPQGQMTTAESERRLQLESRLRHYGLSFAQFSDWWPQIEVPRYEHWDPLIPDLAKEAAEGGGRITDYYVNGLLKIAEKAIPAIDEIELESGSPSA